MPSYLEENGIRIRGALARIRMLMATRNLRNREECLEAFRREGLDCNDSVFLRDETWMPASFSARVDNKLWVFIDGITTRFQGEGIYRGYTDRDEHGPGSYWFRRAAENIFQGNIRLFGRWDSVYLTGYSAGGAICYYLPQLFRNPDHRGRTIDICTFGAPRPGFRDLTTGINFTHARYMNSDDAVCLIPPRQETWSIWGGFLGTATERRFNQFAHPQGGINISMTGELTSRGTPESIPAPPSASIGVWLHQQMEGLENPHSLTVYYARLLMAARNLPGGAMLPGEEYQPDTTVGASGSGGNEDGPGLPDPMEARQPGAPPPAGRVPDLPRPVVEQLNRIARVQNEMPPRIPEDKHFTCEKEGGVWVVKFGGWVVAAGPSRRHCSSMAKMGNLFLKRMQSSAYVDVQTLRDTFEQYLAFASNPDSGFQPQLNTTFPGR